MGYGATWDLQNPDFMRGYEAGFEAAREAFKAEIAKMFKEVQALTTSTSTGD